jgi:hypothetical protein
VICFAKPVLTEDLYVVEKEEFQELAICAIRTLETRRSIFIKDKPIFLSERMLHKDYDRNASVAKTNLVVILKWLVIKTVKTE